MEFVSECGNCPIGITLYGNVSFIHFLYGGIQLCGMIFLTSFLRLKKLNEDNNQDVGYTLLPIYNIVIAYCILIGLLVGIESLINIDQNLIYVKSSLFFAFHSCSEGVAVLLLYRSLGYRAIRNSFLFGVTWGFIASVVPTLTYVLTSSFYAYAVSVLFVYIVTTLFYLSLYVLPISVLFRRPALIIYARWFTAMNSILVILFVLDTVRCDNTSCYAEMITAVVEFLNPFIVLYALKQDSLYWQGLYASSDLATLNRPLLGIWRLGDDTISCITETINQLEKKVVPIIPFTQLQLDTSMYYPGGSARVYRGVCLGKEVAIKILFCMELTPESVVTFCEEASLLYSLKHPNLVTCHGVSIMPPAVSIVTEFCHFGSLFDFLYNTDVISDFGSIAGRSSSKISQKTRAPRLAQISEKSNNSQSADNDSARQDNTRIRRNDSNKTPREEGAANESLLVETKQPFSLFNVFTWMGGRTRNIISGDGERTVSDSYQQFFDAQAPPVATGPSEATRRPERRVTFTERRPSRDDGNASVASFDTVNQSSKASSASAKDATAGAALLALGNQGGSIEETSASITSFGRVASGRVSSGRVSSGRITSVASADGSKLGSVAGILQSIANDSNHFTPGSSFQLYGTRTASGSYQDTGALAFFQGSSSDGKATSNQESYSYTVDTLVNSTNSNSALGKLSDMTGGINNTEDENVNVQVTELSMSLQSRRGSVDGSSDRSAATSDFMTTILRANSMQSSLGGSELGDLLIQDSAFTPALDHSEANLPSPELSDNASPVLSTSPLPSQGQAGSPGNFVDNGRPGPVANVIIPTTGIYSKSKASSAPPLPQFEARLVSGSGPGGGSNRKTLILQRIASGSFSQFQSNTTGSGSRLMKSADCSDVLVMSETSQKLIENMMEDISNSMSRLTTSPLTSHSGVSGPKENDLRNRRKNEVYRSLVSVMKLFESSEMNFGLGPLDAANRGAAGGQKGEPRARFMSPVAARRGSGGGPGGGGGGGGGSVYSSARGSQQGSVRSSRQGSVKGSILGSVRGSVRESMRESRHSRWSLESGNIDSLLLSTKYNNDADALSRGPEASPNSTGWRLGQTIPYSLCLRMMRDCVAGVEFLHRLGIVHCDIKSLNFLVTKDFVVKLSDLGEARILPQRPDGSQSGSNNPSRTHSRSVSGGHPAALQPIVTGSTYAIPIYPNRISSSTVDNNGANNNGQDGNLFESALPRNINWSPPEVLAGNVHSAEKSIDVWGLAMVLSEILIGEVPFDSEEFRQLSLYEFLGTLSDGARPVLNEKTAPSVPRGELEWIEELLSDAWDYEARLRCTAKSMLEKIEERLYQGRSNRKM